MSELYSPGADGNAGDLWNEDPRGADAPKRKLGTDPKLILVVDEG